MNIVLRLSIWGMFIFLGGCVSEPPIPVSEVTFFTSPPDGTITMMESGRILQHGDRVALPAGAYSLIATKTGYRVGKTLLKTDGVSPQSITVALGKGYATADLSTTVSDALIKIKEISFSGSQFSGELDAGEYEVTVQHPGYHSIKEYISVEAGKPIEKKYDLLKVSTHGDVNFITSPPGGSVSFRGRQFGESTPIIKDLPFGHYSANAVKKLDEETRLEGNKAFELNQTSKKVVINLNERKKLFDGEWLLEKVALEKEQARYKSQRVKNPVLLKVSLNNMDSFSSFDEQRLANIFMGVMRVGDRISFQTKTGKWIIWKRHKNITPSFMNSLKDLIEGKEHANLWKHDPVSSTVSLQLAKIDFGKIAYAMHRTRSAYAIVDLDKDAIQGSTEKIYRSNSDGVITLIVSGAKGAEFSGLSQVDSRTDFDDSVFIISPGNTPITIKWKQKPTRLFAISDSSEALSSKSKDPLKLQKGEKKLISLSDRNRVVFVKRLSHGPDYQNWLLEEFEASGPLADQINLNTDEIGPNKASGKYNRIWIARYQTSTGISQRQIDLTYRVLDETKDFESDQFFRRDE